MGGEVVGLPVDARPDVGRAELPGAVQAGVAADGVVGDEDGLVLNADLEAVGGRGGGGGEAGGGAQGDQKGFGVHGPPTAREGVTYASGSDSRACGSALELDGALAGGHVAGGVAGGELDGRLDLLAAP